VFRGSPLLVVLAALFVVSCGGEEEVTTSVTNQASPSSASPTPPGLETIAAESLEDPEIVAVGRSTCVSGVCLNLNSLIFHPFKPETEGLDGVLFDITIENQSFPADVQYDVSEFLAVDASGFVYQPQPGAGSPPLSAAKVPQGLKSQGQVLFAFEEGAEPMELRWDGEPAEIIVLVAPDLIGSRPPPPGRSAAAALPP
jgi:hypothetical protein